MLKDKLYVYCNFVGKTIMAYRQSNQTILVDNHKLPDSDRLIIEDRYGHRYERVIDLEGFAEGYYVFTMI